MSTEIDYIVVPDDENFQAEYWPDDEVDEETDEHPEIPEDLSEFDR